MQSYKDFIGGSLKWSLDIPTKIFNHITYVYTMSVKTVIHKQEWIVFPPPTKTSILSELGETRANYFPSVTIRLLPLQYHTIIFL